MLFSPTEPGTETSFAKKTGDGASLYLAQLQAAQTSET